jgi:hypothetical protein
MAGLVRRLVGGREVNDIASATGVFTRSIRAQQGTNLIDTGNVDNSLKGITKSLSRPRGRERSVQKANEHLYRKTTDIVVHLTYFSLEKDALAKKQSFMDLTDQVLVMQGITFSLDARTLRPLLLTPGGLKAAEVNNFVCISAPFGLCNADDAVGIIMQASPLQVTNLIDAYEAHKYGVRVIHDAENGTITLSPTASRKKHWPFVELKFRLNGPEATVLKNVTLISNTFMYSKGKPSILSLPSTYAQAVEYVTVEFGADWDILKAQHQPACIQEKIATSRCTGVDIPSDVAFSLRTGDVIVPTVNTAAYSDREFALPASLEENLGILSVKRSKFLKKLNLQGKGLYAGKNYRKGDVICYMKNPTLVSEEESTAIIARNGGNRDVIVIIMEGEIPSHYYDAAFDKVAFHGRPYWYFMNCAKKGKKSNVVLGTKLAPPKNVSGSSPTSRQAANDITKISKRIPLWWAQKSIKIGDELFWYYGEVGDLFDEPSAEPIVGAAEPPRKKIKKN